MSSIRVKEKMKDIQSSLPEGVEVKVTYDRSELILRAIENLRHQLTEEMIIVSLGDPVFPLAFSVGIYPDYHHSRWLSSWLLSLCLA